MKLAEKILEEIITPDNCLGIKRKDMPQIDGKDMEEFLKYLKENEVDYERCQKTPRELTPSQSELDTDKADKIFKESKKSENINPLQIPVLISQDRYVLDGHHRWLAMDRNKPGGKLNCIMLGPNAKECLEIMHGFEKSKKRDINDKKVAESILAMHYFVMEELLEADSEYKPLNIPFPKLKQNKVKLTDEERQIVKEGGAEWSDDRSAIMKSKIGEQEYFTTYTHRAYNCCKTLKEAIQRFHAFIKETA